MTPEKPFNMFQNALSCSALSLLDSAAWFIRSRRGIKPDSRESQSAQTGIAP